MRERREPSTGFGCCDLCEPVHSSPNLPLRLRLCRRRNDSRRVFGHETRALDLGTKRGSVPIPCVEYPEKADDDDDGGEEGEDGHGRPVFFDACLRLTISTKS